MEISLPVRQRTIGYFAVFIMLGLSSAALGPALPYLAENTGSLLSQISVLFVVRSGGYLLSSWLGGRLYDRFSGHVLLGICLFTMAGILAAIPFISYLWLLSAAIFLIGVTEGVIDVGGNTLLVWSYRDDVGPFMNALHFFFGAGSFLAPFILAQAIQATGEITFAYGSLALIAVLVLLWMIRLPGPDIPVVDPVSVSSPEEVQENNTRWKVFLLMATTLMLYVGAEVSFGGWIFTFAREMNLAGEAAAAYLTSAFWGAFTLGRLAGIPLATRLSPRLMLGLDYGGCVLSVGAILLFPHSAVVLWAASIALGASMASVFPTTLSLAEKQLSLTGKRTGQFFLFVGIGATLLPWLIGQFFERVGPRATMVILLIDLALAGVLFAVVALRSRSQGPEYGKTRVKNGEGG
jgi:FHS family Na+ dependent glucose MFS transporter 1